MTVKDLMNLLKDFPQDAEIVLANKGDYGFLEHDDIFSVEDDDETDYSYHTNDGFIEAPECEMVVFNTWS